MAEKQIIGIGGGGFTNDQYSLLDLYVLASCSKPNPVITFVPTASGDSMDYIHNFYRFFDKYQCRPEFFSAVSPERGFGKKLLKSDIIYVGGGNSKSMLSLWREWGVDKLLKQAYEQGTILAGVSAGFVCWFEECLTDSIPGKLSPMKCLGLLKGSGCPHYSSLNNRRQMYHQTIAEDKISPGYAATDDTALHFVNGKLLRAVSASRTAEAFSLSKKSKVHEEKIDTIYLGTKENFAKYIKDPLTSLSESRND